MKKNYYSVRKGKTPGIYNTWAECEEQVKGYSGAVYKKFSTMKEASDFMGALEQKTIIDESNLKTNEVVAYVDGSYDINEKTYSYGVVMFTSAGKETFSGRENDPSLAEMRNVSGELKGAIVAMEIAIEKEKEILYLHFDYTGIEQWAKGQWKTNKEGTKAYKKFYDNIKGNLKVEFVKVKAHSGIEYNEEADKLAKEAIIN